MPACPKHPKFFMEDGVYYRAADPNCPSDWVPKNEKKRDTFYSIAIRGDEEEMAGLMGEAQMIHSNESSADSGFVSVARCPVCFVESRDPKVMKILQEKRFLNRLEINPKNQIGAPFVFHVTGNVVGATETEALVLLDPGKSLLDYHEGYITMGYINTKK